jgi:hypothetical protein
MKEVAEFIKRHFNVSDPWIDSHINSGNWRHNAIEDRIYHWLTDYSQVMSTINKEPVYRGDEIFYEKNPGQRVEFDKYVVFAGEDRCFLLFLKEAELKTKAWWLLTKGKYNSDWESAEWKEI